MTKPSVVGIERALDVFEAFQLSRRPLSLTELAEAADIPKSTCHAIVATLLARGYLYSMSRPRGLYPTRRMHDVASDILRHDPFIERALPLLERLRDATRETVILGKRQGEAVVYLQVLEDLHPIRYSARAGDIKPLHSSAIGKALLGSLKEAELRAWLADRVLPAVTPFDADRPGAAGRAHPAQPPRGILRDPRRERDRRLGGGGLPQRQQGGLRRRCGRPATPAGDQPDRVRAAAGGDVQRVGAGVELA